VSKGSDGYIELTDKECFLSYERCLIKVIFSIL